VVDYLAVVDELIGFDSYLVDFAAAVSHFDAD
jgi:hypothetical protein